MKLALSLVILSLVLATCYAQSNHASWGDKGDDDTLVFSDYIKKSSKESQKVEEKVTYPPKGVINNQPITAIRAWDENEKGNGATATIIDGGINNTTVTIKFVSKKGHSVKFNLEVFTVHC